MAQLREIATWPRVLGLIVVPAVSLLVDHELGSMGLTALLLTVYVAILFAFLIDHHRIPTAYLKFRKLHAEARAKALSHPMLERRYDDGIEETKKLLTEIIDEKFEYRVTEVPEMSVFAMEVVNSSCLLTFPLEESENLLVPRTGTAGRYYSMMVEASRRIKDNGGPGVIRIFIITRSDDIGPSLMSFMRANHEDGIDVRVIFEETLPHRPASINFKDFGCYESKSGQGKRRWVMSLGKDSQDSGRLRYVVDTEDQTYRHYKSYGDDILRQSMSLEAFEELLLDPMNGKLWPLYFAQRRYEMLPPHGLSDEDAEFIVESAMRKVTAAADATVLVLGFTPRLIGKLSDRQVGRLISVDQCRTKPHNPNVTFKTENWLKLSPGYDADAIVFDESINNLSRLQLGLFFSNMARALKPGGVLVGRAMGRFDVEKAEAYSAMSFGRIIELLRSAAGTTHDDVAPLIICLLHARSMAFNGALSTADCETWNTSLLRLRNEALITSEECLRWSLPFNFRLLSPDQALLVREAGNAGLNLAEMRQVEGAYTQKWADTEHFYRILSFENA